MKWLSFSKTGSTSGPVKGPEPSTFLAEQINHTVRKPRVTPNVDLKKKKNNLKFSQFSKRKKKKAVCYSVTGDKAEVLSKDRAAA